MRGKPDIGSLWTRARALVARFSEAVDGAAFLDDAVDAVVDLLSADRGLIVLFDEGDGRRIVNARGAGRSLGKEERIELVGSLLTEVRARGETIAFDVVSGAGSPSMVGLGVVAAIAVPLRSRRRDGGVRGAFYVDFKKSQPQLELHREFLEVGAALVAAVLDEILALTPAEQERLLALLARREHPRVIATTGGNLAAAVKDGRFRAELQPQVAAVVITLPPLRARRGDLPIVAERMLAQLDPARGWRLSPEALRALQSEALDWPGNLRQLEATLRRACTWADGEEPGSQRLEPPHLMLDAGSSFRRRWERLRDERRRLDAVERALVEEAMGEVGGVVAYAARELGIPRTTLASRLDALGLRGS